MTNDSQIVMNTRLPVELVRRLDEAVATMNELYPAKRHSRSEVIRQLLVNGLNSFDAYAARVRAERRR